MSLLSDMGVMFSQVLVMVWETGVWENRNVGMSHDMLRLLGPKRKELKQHEKPEFR